MIGIDALRSVLDHPAPGMLFAEHEYAEAGERVYLTPHRAAKPAGILARAMLKRLTGRSPTADSLLEFYRRHDGCDLCEMPGIPELHRRRPAFAVSLFPIRRWEQATRPWLPGGEMYWAMEDCDLYRSGTWRVIGGFASEGMSIVMFFDGTYKGVNQAGRCHCVGLDGYLGYEEVLAESFDILLKQVSTDLIALLERVGFTWSVKGKDGRLYGDPPKSYMPDARNHAALVS